MRYVTTALVLLLAAPGYALWAPVESLAEARDACGLAPEFDAVDLLDDGRHGWVVGTFRTHGGQRLGVFRTTDGGHTWSVINTELEFTPAVAVDFVDANHGRILARHNRIYRTEDGGETWERDRVAPTDRSLQDLQMVTASDGYACGWVSDRERTAVFRYQADGPGWDSVERWQVGTLNALVARRADRVWTAGLTSSGAGTSRRLNDSGWEEMDIPSEVAALSFTNNHRGYAACSAGRIFLTTNGGASWRELYTPVLSDLVDIQFGEGTDIALSVEDQLALVTEDRGESWEVERVPEGAIALAWDGTDHLLLGRRNLYRHRQILRVEPTPELQAALARPQPAEVLPLPSDLFEEPTWREASELWDAMNVGRSDLGMGGGRPSRLRLASFLDDGQHGWIWGRDYRNLQVLLYTDNGGLSWDKIAAGTELPLASRGMQLVTPDTGWIWGLEPFICRTETAGERWALEPIHGPHSDDITVVDELSMLDTERGYALAEVEGLDEKLMLVRQPTGIWMTRGTVQSASHIATSLPDFLWLGATTGRVQVGSNPRDMETVYSATNAAGAELLAEIMPHSRYICWLRPARSTKMLRTTNGGSSWDRVMWSHDPADYAVDADIADGNRCIALTRLGKVMQTVDGGENWEQVLELEDEIDPWRSYVHTFGNYAYVIAGSQWWTNVPAREPATAHDDFDPVRPVLADRRLTWSDDSDWAGDGVHPTPGRAGVQSIFRVQWEPINASEPGELTLQVRVPGDDPDAPTVERLRVADWWTRRETGGSEWGVAFTPTVAGEYEYRFYGTDADGETVTGEPTEWRTWTVE